MTARQRKATQTPAHAAALQRVQRWRDDLQRDYEAFLETPDDSTFHALHVSMTIWQRVCARLDDSQSYLA